MVFYQVDTGVLQTRNGFPSHFLGCLPSFIAQPLQKIATAKSARVESLSARAGSFMFFECGRQPGIQTHFFSIRRANSIRLTGQQTLARRQPDKIFRRFDLALEMLVLRFDVIDRFLWSVRLPVANEGGVGFRSVIEKVVD